MIKINLVGLMIIASLTSCSIQPVHSPDKEFRALNLIDQGVLQLRAGELEQARASFEVAYELAPLAAAIDGLGCVAMMSGDIDEAERLFNRALSMDPNYTVARGNLALLFEATERYSEAADSYRIAIKARPDDAKLRNNYALFLKRHGRTFDVRPEDELRRARALLAHPVIDENYQVVSGSYE